MAFILRALPTVAACFVGACGQQTTEAADGSVGADAGPAAQVPDIGIPASCEALRPIRIMACAKLDRPPDEHVNAFSIRGAVSGVHNGLWQCSAAIGGNPNPHVGGEPWFLDVVPAEGSGDGAMVGLLADDLKPMLEVGDVVTVDYEWENGGFSPDVGSLTLRDAEGRLVLWTGEAGSAAELPLPDEIDVEPGRRLCVRSDDCGEVALGTLRVSVEGESVEVNYGGRAEVGDYLVLHGGDEHELSAAGCADWFAAHTALLVVRR